MLAAATSSRERPIQPQTTPALAPLVNTTTDRHSGMKEQIMAPSMADGTTQAPGWMLTPHSKSTPCIPCAVRVE